MSFEILWHFPALATLYQLPFQAAVTIDSSVIRFAQAGVGHIEWVAPYHRLRAGAHDVVLAIDREARTITVLRIYRGRSRT